MGKLYTTKCINMYYNNIMDTVYCVFKAYGDGDGFVCYDLIGVYTDFDKCVNDVYILDIPQLIDPVHPDMTFSNNYTIMAKRSTCSGDCRYGHYGGYIIEQVKINKIDV